MFSWWLICCSSNGICHINEV